MNKKESTKLATIHACSSPVQRRSRAVRDYPLSAAVVGSTASASGRLDSRPLAVKPPVVAAVRKSWVSNRGGSLDLSAHGVSAAAAAGAAGAAPPVSFEVAAGVAETSGWPHVALGSGAARAVVAEGFVVAVVVAAFAGAVEVAAVAAAAGVALAAARTSADAAALAGVTPTGALAADATTMRYFGKSEAQHRCPYS